MSMLELIFLTIISVFALALIFILVYSIAQIELVFRYLNKNKVPTPSYQDSKLPKVCIQLPIFNERYVAKRLLAAVIKIKYPSELLEIQVLDDSTDETKELLQQEIRNLQANGTNITYLHRSNRKGYKAGALREGILQTKAEIIAIFDADFIPNENFLLKTIPHFNHPKIGMVQTCWEHINKNYSLITKLQAFGLDAHFSVEQVGRNAKGNFINFNGTAGTWRKSCILDAGNWEADTLTEDLDLSYRAQLKDWKFLYLEDVKSPAELPPVMSALRTQQYRWTKGGAETAKKHLKTVLGSHKSFSDKWHGAFHLLNSSIFICIFISGLLSVPILFLKHKFPAYNHLFLYASVFLISFISISALYAVSSMNKHESRSKAWKYFLTHYPLFLSFSMGLSFHNAIAVLEGYFGKKTPFIRTPKFNVKSSKDSWQKNSYIKRKLNLFSVAEGFLFFYFTTAVVSSFILQDFSLLLFHVLLAGGFGMVFTYSIKHANQT